MAVLKVAASQVANSTAFWPPTLPDSVETIAASYIDTDPSSKIRIFNLSPTTEAAGMTLNGKEIASSVAYGSGSTWVNVPTAAAQFGFVDDVSRKTLASKAITPAAPPIGNTAMLLGVDNSGDDHAFKVAVVPLVDAPEGGTCHPSPLLQ